jgi:hypothetical protein
MLKVQLTFVQRLAHGRKSSQINFTKMMPNANKQNKLAITV